MTTESVRRQMNIHMQQSECAKQQKLLQLLLRAMHVSVRSHMPAESLCSGHENRSAMVIYHISHNAPDGEGAINVWLQKHAATSRAKRSVRVG